MGRLGKFLAVLGLGRSTHEPSRPPEAEPRSTPPPSAVELPADPMPQLDATPDLPEGFGYKVKWFAVRALDPALVLDALGLVPEAAANWSTGLAASYRWSASDEVAKWVFASPAIGGWVFLVGKALPYPINTEDGDHGGIGRAFDQVFERLKSRFEEVQFFGSYRVVGFVAWARAIRGEPDRVFAFGDGSVYANAGQQAPEEAALGFPRLDGLSVSDATDRIFALAEEQDAQQAALKASGVPAREAFALVRQGKAGAIPDEGDVVALAGLWSVNPTQLDDGGQTQEPGTGLVARLPKHMMRAPMDSDDGHIEASA